MKKIFLIVIFIFIPLTTQAWEDCPYGLVNDPYPGQCGRYIDTNQDHFCDHSQTALEVKNNSTSNLVQVKEIKSYPKITYHFLPISLVLIITYIFSYLLSKKKIISILNHRRFWNILLLISFLISGLLGILLVIKINFGLNLNLPFNFLFWHVEAGIAMAIISIFHIVWHWSYFKIILNHKK